MKATCVKLKRKIHLLQTIITWRIIGATWGYLPHLQHSKLVKSVPTSQWDRIILPNALNSPKKETAHYQIDSKQFKDVQSLTSQPSSVPPIPTCCFFCSILFCCSSSNFSCSIRCRLRVASCCPRRPR